MDVTSSPWKIRVVTLACVLHPSPHTAAKNLERAEQVLMEWEIDTLVLQAATQDTTGNSITTFQTIDTTEIMPCCAHTSQLFVQHSSDEVPLIKQTFEAMNTCATKLRGYPKRIQELFRICKDLQIKELTPRKICTSRWDTREEVATRSTYLLPAYRLINPVSVFDNLDVRTSWENALSVVDGNSAVIEEILPLMRLNAQWTQILSSKSAVTISLVRLAIRSLRSHVDLLETKVTDSRNGSAASRSLVTKLDPFVRSAKRYLDHYFGDDFYNSGLLRVAEYLDPRTVWCIEDSDELKTTVRALKLLANNEDILMPLRNHPQVAVGLGSAASSTNPRQSPIDKESALYTNLMVAKGEETCNGIDPLIYWATEGAIAFPILAGIAARILPIPSTSASVEQLFSVSGRVVSTARASLNCRHVNELCCLHQWLIDEGLVSKDAANATEKRAQALKKFAYLNLRREVEGPEQIESDDEEEEEVVEED